MSALVANEARTCNEYLAGILDDTIRDSAGSDAVALVARLRKLASDRREGAAGAQEDIVRLIENLDETQLRVAIRAFTLYLDLLNVVEDRQRLNVLGQRARQVYPKPRGESIREAVYRLKDAGLSPTAVQTLINQLHVELVFTAHPTEAKRRSVRRKLRAIRDLVHQVDSDPIPEQRDRIEHQIRGEVARLWQTDFIRPWRPSVMQEVGRGLSIKPVLWQQAPRINSDLRHAIQECYGEDVLVRERCLTFGTWIGGDRDGHPGVTADITRDTFNWLRQEAITFHLLACDQMVESISISRRQVEIGGQLSSLIDDAISRWPVLQSRLAPIPPDELCRKWLSIIRWRLEETQASAFDTTALPGAYPSACELAGDLNALIASIKDVPVGRYTRDELNDWRSQVETFGFHLARLDIRQNAKVYRDVLAEVFRQAGLCEAYHSLSETERQQLLLETMNQRLQVNLDNASPIVHETLQLYRNLHQVAVRYTSQAIGTLVISMTSAASDVLTVLWLWRQTSTDDFGRGATSCPPIVPLLETIEDLQHGPTILADMLEIEAYRHHLHGHGNRQIIMLGYSDSTKDGGYLTACWSLYRAQQKLVALAEQHQIQLTFFHGRGGSLGRGGGPAARSILSLPEGTFVGSLRLTEQGEVLADRYDDPNIAYRHLEQVISSSLLAAAGQQQVDASRWCATMEQLSQNSLIKYRDLLERSKFVEFFRCTTPISEIEQLPIGSRPSRRKSDGGLADLRAIPWVFSWTQSRCLIPAWYGLGEAISSLIDNPTALADLRSMYKQWPFFRALVDNAELALAKSDPDIASQYAALAQRSEAMNDIASLIAEEYGQARRAILLIAQRDELLDGIPWLKESIQMRNRLIDPLNLIQVELLRRREEQLSEGDSGEELRHLTRLSINGIASGMRTSG